MIGHARCNRQKRFECGGSGPGSDIFRASTERRSAKNSEQDYLALARDPVVRFATDALASGEKRKRKQTMTVLITIAALFAVQIYTPAFARLGRACRAVAMSRSNSAALSEMPEFPFPSKPVKLKAAATSKLGNSQTQEVYGEYAISDHFLIVGKHLVQNTRLAAATRRTTYHEFGCKYRCRFWPLAFTTGNPARPSVRISERRICPRHGGRRANFSSPHVYQNTRCRRSCLNPSRRRRLDLHIADRLSWKRYHLAQSLTVTQFNGWSSGIWKNDYEIHLGYADQISLGWISEIYEDRDQSYASRSSYVAVSFSPPDHRFNLRVLRGQNAVAGRPDTFRGYRLEVGWSFP